MATALTTIVVRTGRWDREVVEAGKLPLLLCLGAFVVAFVVTRVVTRSIRAGRGPLHDHIADDGTHVHHAVAGILVLVTGAFLAVGSPTSSTAHQIAAVAVGLGAALVLDEFALIVRLQDVYWSEEGRVSIEVTCLAAAALGLTLVGVSPFGVDDVGTAELAMRVGAISAVLATLATSFACVLKGKYVLALLGAWVPVVAWVGAVRLARPTSVWSEHLYGADKAHRARARAAVMSHRWGPLFEQFSDVIAGRPSAGTPEPAPPTCADERHR